MALSLTQPTRNLALHMVLFQVSMLFSVVSTAGCSRRTHLELTYQEIRKYSFEFMEMAMLVQCIKP